MITYIVGLLERDLPTYAKYAKPYFINRKSVVIDVIAQGRDDTLAMQYNRGIEEIFRNQHESYEEVVVFLHPDVIILDDDFEEKLLSIFLHKSQIGLVGVIGATYLPEKGSWWSAEAECLRGQIIQEYEDKPTKHMIYGDAGYYDDLMCVDGLFLAIRANLLAQGLRFDERYPNYHFTDIDVCFSVIRLGFKIAVIDTLMLHKSEGKRADDFEWHQNKDILFEKWKNNKILGNSIRLNDLLD